jgi:hypothetical protein
MLTGLTKRFRIKAALTMALLYGFCSLAPHAAIALANSAAHCLEDMVPAHTQDHQVAIHAHIHADGSAHQHSDQNAPHEHSGADKKSHSESCCGLFSVTAIAQEPGFVLAAPPSSLTTVTGLDYILAGRGPDRINRPPIA